ncbi:unnamed protein product [Diabrotica balteata]|uniref:Uncharacterized protein n=1 Tax=Diabrotica balteata TaxID=107213 RepID=A0A9N9XIH6_DIABA|nr:unnamed protein product [Diabrotica balteata]
MDVYNNLKDILHNVEYVALACDGWTSRSTEAYLTVTCHYVDKSYNLNSAVLSTKPWSNGVNHTSENITEALKDIMKEWNLEHKVSCVVTDNAANMLKACDLIQKRHLPCYAHTLILVVQDNLECVQNVIKKCKDIVTFFKSSTNATEMFKKEQSTSELLQEVPTRWNSTFYMIQRILKTNDAIGRTILKLRKAPQPLSVDDIAVLADIERVLICFDTTKKISGALTELTTEKGKNFFNKLIESVKKRLFPYESRTVTRIGTLLDPRSKKEGFK